MAEVTTTLILTPEDMANGSAFSASLHGLSIQLNHMFSPTPHGEGQPPDEIGIPAADLIAVAEDWLNLMQKGTVFLHTFTHLIAESEGKGNH